MVMYSYDQVLTDVRQVYQQLTGFEPPKLDPKNPRFPLPAGVDPVSVVQNEINYLNLFLINSGISLRLSKTPTWVPPAEVYQTGKEYVIDLDLAGVGEEDLQIQNVDHAIIVRGARRFRKRGEDSRYLSTERVYGSFERFFPLPQQAQPENLKKTLSNGVLEITIPVASAGSDRGGEQ